MKCPSATRSGADRIVGLTGLETKGLEFDGIVVVRPQEIEDESATGRATLYVVLTAMLLNYCRDERA